MFDRLRTQKKLFILVGVILVLFLLVTAFVNFTGIGVRKDVIGSWGNPGVPLLEWQIWLVAGLSFFSLLLLIRVDPSPGNPARTLKLFHRSISIDVFIALGIWAVCAILWISTPLIPAYIATPGRPPNFEIYPFSDAQTYDTYAQSILIGNGLNGLMGNIPQRAFYILLLAGFHLIAGQNYQAVILVQSLVLAIFPVVLYFVGKEIHSRPAGISAALMAILRDVTAVQVAPFTDNISYSKLYLSEIPTAICLGLSILFFVRWLKNPGSRKISGLTSGGFLGIAMLIRTQSAVVLPIYLVLGLFALRGRRLWKEALIGLALLALGLIVSISPWMLRNARVAGGITLDNSDTQTMVMAQRYNDIHFENAILRLPGETEAEYSRRLMQMTIQGMLKHPADTLAVIMGHFINNEIDNSLLFSIRFRINHLTDFLWPDTAFWQSWAGGLSFPQALLLFGNLFVIAIGIAAAYHLAGVIGLIPLGVNIVYNFSTAVFRSSGERFLFPVDWIIIIYFSAGVIQLFILVLALIGRDPEKPFSILSTSGAFSSSRLAPAHFPAYRLLAASLIFIAIGSCLPLSEIVFPVRYPAQTKEQILGSMFSDQSVIAAAGSQLGNIKLLAQQPDTIVARGRALFPRFFDTGEAEPKTAKEPFTKRDFPRVVLYVVGQQNAIVLLPLKESPSYFPNITDITFIACPRDDYIEMVLALLDQGNVAYLTGNQFKTSCDAIP